MIFSSFNVTFPSSSSSELGSCLLLPSLRNKHRKLGVLLNMNGAPICKPYYQSSTTLHKDHSTWVLIYCPYLYA